MRLFSPHGRGNLLLNYVPSSASDMPSNESKTPTPSTRIDWVTLLLLALPCALFCFPFPPGIVGIVGIVAPRTMQPQAALALPHSLHNHPWFFLDSTKLADKPLLDLVGTKVEVADAVS